MSYYIGIGVSAGGLKVLQELISKLSLQSGNIYLIAQHLDIHKKSSLVEILSRYSTLEVSEVDPNCTFLPNHVYVIPPNSNLLIRNNHLVLEKIDEKDFLHTPSIDLFLESLAIAKKSKAIGVILTGSGSDGTLGLQKIKEKGGMTIVQSPQEAEYSSMPQSAIENVEIDYILPINEIATYFENPLSIDNTSFDPKLKGIFKLLNEKENLSIHKYKIETVVRRIHKRMLLVHTKDFDTYLEYIKSNPQELYLLRQDILIGVTKFFRDQEAFKSLKKELYYYLKDKPENYELRVWSVACSTGEEVYSLAILVTQISQELKRNFNLHIFATDIDDVSLAVARKARYSADSISKLDKDILDQFFIAVKNGYKVVESIRQKIVFTHHNILSDPPFINQNIISCRNFLIYITPETQKDVFTLFHHALKSDGILFLGSSESTMLKAEYFSPISIEHKVYKKEEVNNPPKISNHYFSKHLENHTTPSFHEVKSEEMKSIEEHLNDSIFDFFAPNCIVVDKNYNIVYKKGNLPFLKLSDGFTTLNLLDNIDENIRYDIGIMLKKSFESSRVESTKFIEFNTSLDEKAFVKITAHPFGDVSKNSMTLLYFQLLELEDIQFNAESVTLTDESSMVKSLSTQLNTSRDELHSISDELTIYKENMQALSEELQSTNEELQSSNEELETSNEELQSSNEELQSSILDTQKIKDELALILNSSQDAIIGLDLEGRHTFVNAATLNLLGYTENELIGKNGHSLWHHTKLDKTHYPIEDCPFHRALANAVSGRGEDLFYKKDGTPIEVEVLQNPIIKDKKPIGAVISFYDISEKNRLKRLSAHEHQLADLYLNVTGSIVMRLDIYGDIDMINAKGAEILGFKQEELLGMNWFDNFIPKSISQEVKSVFSKVINHNADMVTDYKNIIIDKDKKEHIILWTNSVEYDLNGDILGVIASGVDVSKEEGLSRKLFEQEHLYRLTFEEADIGIAHVSLEGAWIDTNSYLSSLLGYSKEEFRTFSVQDITHKDDRQYDEQLIKELVGGQRESYHFEKRYIHKNGETVWVSLNVVVLKDELNKPLYILKIIRDITEVKLLMYQLEMEKNELNRIIEFTPIPIMMHTKDGEVILINKAFEQNSGYLLEELPSMDILMQKLYTDKNSNSRAHLRNDYENCTRSEVIEHVIRTKEGDKHTWLLKSSPVRRGLNKQESFISSAIDITDIKNKDDIMLAQSRQAAMGDMLAMVSHQWRQPLSVISMSANIIKAQQELGETIHKDELDSFIKTVAEQTQYLSSTIDDFRDFFKPDKSKELIAISSIFEKIMTLVQKSLENNSIEINLISKVEQKLFTYPNQLIQVLLNFINNAKDAIKEKDGVKGLIKVVVQEIDEEIVLGVIDNGGGIDPSIKETISQPYVSTKSKNGTGLGLYMSKVIAQKHLDARIFWESDTKGSSFYIAMKKNTLKETTEDA